ncbi:hypothetical protein J7432_08090 [Xanthomonas axonopodis pv. begoniae]|nr:hypothetical protein [Xanthomonas axonopodis pv. begoniae]MBO9770820.1 hypothetical protein [Xanthomonas axonopodis pv. begoniae]PPT39336.1 hypothetical protein XabCFBP2524_04360 [Xanthomonas axonopodis pv. begoniae]
MQKMSLCIALVFCLLTPVAEARKVAGMSPIEQSRQIYLRVFQPPLHQQMVQGSIDDLLKVTEAQAKSKWQDHCPEMQPALSSMLDRQLRPSLEKMMNDPALAERIIAAMQTTLSASERVMATAALDSGNDLVATRLIYNNQALAREVGAIMENTLREAQPALMELVKSGSLSLRPIAEMCDARLIQGQVKE